MTWNSEAGRVSGSIIKVRTIGVDYKGHTRYASEDDAQCEIKGTKNDHIAMHRRSIIHFCRDGRASQSAMVFRCAIYKWIAAIEFVHDFVIWAPVGYNVDHEFYG